MTTIASPHWGIMWPSVICPVCHKKWGDHFWVPRQKFEGAAHVFVMERIADILLEAIIAKQRLNPRDCAQCASALETVKTIEAMASRLLGAEDTQGG